MPYVRIVRQYFALHQGIPPELAIDIGEIGRAIQNIEAEDTSRTCITWCIQHQPEEQIDPDNDMTEYHIHVVGPVEVLDCLLSSSFVAKWMGHEYRVWRTNLIEGRIPE